MVRRVYTFIFIMKYRRRSNVWGNVDLDESGGIKLLKCVLRYSEICTSHKRSNLVEVSRTIRKELVIRESVWNEMECTYVCACSNHIKK